MIELLPMEPTHVDAVHRIETAASPDPWSRELFLSEFNGSGSDRLWLVARRDGQVVGFGGVLFVLDEAHVMNLAVDPANHRQGIATDLVSRLLLDAGDRGATGVTLEVRASNAGALALYRRFGFEEAGRRPGYYPDGEDAVIMWVHKIYRPDFRRQLSVRRAEVGEG